MVLRSITSFKNPTLLHNHMSYENYNHNGKKVSETPIIHSLVENLAYYIHTINPVNDQNSNWFHANHLCDQWFYKFGLKSPNTKSEFAERVVSDGGGNIYALAQEIFHQNI